MSKGPFSVGTDIGGTFTDMVVIDADRADRGNSRCRRRPATAVWPSSTASNSPRRTYGLTLEEFTQERRLLRARNDRRDERVHRAQGRAHGLITTRGFADAIFVQRSMGSWTGIGDRSSHYSERRNPVPIVPRRRYHRDRRAARLRRRRSIVPLQTRTSARGGPPVPRRRASVRSRSASCGRSCVPITKSKRPRSCAKNGPTFSSRSRARSRRSSASTSAAPPRSSTRTSGPIISRYVELLENRLRANGFTGDFTVMDSAGGVVDAAEAGYRSVELMVSGPAGGVLASAALARRLGFSNVITGDMGGTSFDAASSSTANRWSPR